MEMRLGRRGVEGGLNRLGFPGHYRDFGFYLQGDGSHERVLSQAPREGCDLI